MIFFKENRKGMVAVIGLALLIAVLPGFARAETAADEFALFKRTISPAWQWGENGILTVPKATPIGKYNIYVAMSGQEAGEIQGEKLYTTNASLVVGTSDDAEIGYTRRQLIWSNGDRTDLKSDVFHIKTRVLHLTDSFLPEISAGVIGTSLKSDKQFNSTKDTLLNPFVAATFNIPLFSERHRLAITGTAEKLYSAGDQTETFYNAGLDIELFDKGFILAVEYQGIGKDTTDPIMNAGAKFKFFDMLSIGGGKFNMSQNANDKKVSTDKSYSMVFLSFELPLGKK